MSRIPISILVLAAAFLAGAGVARAQAPIALIINPSIRASGMGGASNAVFWGGDPNDWGNPALLAYHRGVRYSNGETQLVPQFAPDVFFRTQRVNVGVAGVGFSIPGNLRDYGSALLDYGNSGLDGFESIQAWGIGVSLSGLVESAALLGKAEPPAFTRFMDVAAGVNGKHVSAALFPGSADATDAIDMGFLVRITPLNQIGAPGLGDEALPFRVDASYGWSVLDADDSAIDLGFGHGPTVRMQRNGLGVQVAMGLPGGLRGTLPDWVARSLDPLISLGLAGDWEHVQEGDDDSRGYDVTRLGGEVVVANLMTLRIGHIADRTGDIIGGTDGWGLGFRISDLAGFRYDQATVPQARSGGLRDLKRHGYTAFVDPMRLIQALY